MPDPITALEHFDDGATHVPALPPAEVRRRGDRMRRRRNAGAGVAALAVVAAIGGGVVALQHGPTSSSPILGHPTAPPTASAAPDPATGVLRHDGYRGLRLGMTATRARTVPDVSVGTGAGCRPVSFVRGPGAGEQVSGALSAKYGVAGLFAAGRVHTPEGIRLGSTRDEVQAAYRGKLTTGPDFLAVRFPDGTEYEFVVDQSGRVTEIAAALTVQDCFG